MSDLMSHLLGPGIPAVLAAERRHGLLAALADAPADATELATRRQLDPRALGLVMDALHAMGLCDRDARGRYLTRAPDELPWSGLDAFLRTGQLVVDLDDPEIRDRMYARFVNDLAQRAESAARYFAAQLPVAPTILDVGAGSGVWSVEMALRDSATRVTALDVEPVLARFREYAATRGLPPHAIEELPGSWDQPLPTGAFDRVVLANVLHLLTAEDAASLVARTRRTLREGGDLVIVDCLPQRTRPDRVAASIYALHLGLRTNRGGVHSPEALAAWCEAAGLSAVEAIHCPTQPAIGALRATAA